MSSTATLTYEVTAVGPTVPSNLETAMAAVVLNHTGIAEITGAALASDTTTIAGPVVTRTVVFDIATTDFQRRFPVGSDQGAPFRGIYTSFFGAQFNTQVNEQPVVIA